MLSPRCDWKLWLDKVTNKVLRSVCSSHLSWPQTESVPAWELSEGSLTRVWLWEVRGTESRAAEDNKKIAINGLFCLDWWVSHLGIFSQSEGELRVHTSSCDQSEAGKLSPLCSDNNRSLREKNGPNKIGTCQIKVICQPRTWWARRKKVYCFLQHAFFSAAFINWGDFKKLRFEALSSFCSV